MKKLVFILVVCFAAAYTVKELGKREKNADLLLYNIEALAADENATNVYCVMAGSVDCPISNAKVEYVIDGYSLRK